MTVSIVAIGGTVSPASSTEAALGVAIRAAREAGATVRTFDGAYLAALPHYRCSAWNSQLGAELVDAVRDCDGLLIASPGYHGSVSGLVKNGLDYLEELSRDKRPYLDGRSVGLIATAYGDQATMSTLGALRGIVHALRGWPTPFGAAIRTVPGLFDEEGGCTDPRISGQLELVGRQVAESARQFKLGGVAA